MQPYSSTDTATTSKNSHFVLSERSNFHMVDNLSVLAFPMHMLTSLSVDEILLLRYMNWFTNLRGLASKEEMAPSWLKHISKFQKKEKLTNYLSFYSNYFYLTKYYYFGFLIVIQAGYVKQLYRITSSLRLTLQKKIRKI